MRFLDDKIKIICETLNEQIYEVIDELDCFSYAPCEYKKGDLNCDGLEFQPFKMGERVKGWDKHFVFKAHFTTPTDKKNQKHIVFSLKTGREGQWDATNPQCIVYLNGEIAQGLDVNHREILLEFDTEYDIIIYFYVGMIDSLVEFIPSLQLMDLRVEKIYYDLYVPYQTLLILEPNSEDYNTIIKHLEKCVNMLDLRAVKSEEYYKSIENAENYIVSEFYKKACGKSDVMTNCIGHTHIDVAWLWTFAQTREKAQRTFATVLQYMDEYPEYKFMSSQPQLYQYVKEEAPALFERIKEKVKEGRWEAEGAMWLEADCNLTSGESLIRQIMFGKRFFQEEFGVDNHVLWLPDVFGYSAALPQILKKCGVDKFVTSKISWNEYNLIPYDTFMWQGIDGSEVFTTFITAAEHKEVLKNVYFTTYNGYICPEQVLGTWERYQQKDYNNETMIPFGYGDGGGGPTKDQLEAQRRLAYGIPGLPKTKIAFAGEYLQKSEKNFTEYAKECKRTPKWVGELYLEFHRGTYTSIAKNKKNNRFSELLYQKIETQGVIDMIWNNGVYDNEKINEGYEKILLNQFHDVIPGSSIKEVYDDSDKYYNKILGGGYAIEEEKLSSICKSLKTEGGIFVYNPNCFENSDVVRVGDDLIFAENIPAFGYKVIKDEKSKNSINVTKSSIENKFFRIEIDEKGGISRLFDKRYDRDVLECGKIGNELQVFEDLPRQYDAWEISCYYKQKMWILDDVVDVKIINEGARAGLKLTKKFLSSTVTQTIYLYEELDKIDFDTVIDWKETHVLLKAAFPLNIHATEATYDIQFGHLKRPTHENTDWEKAKFEVCAQKWADMSDNGYGVSILNNCKYGHNAEGNTLKLTLLKCATYPNLEADKEIHSFTYSLYPHTGTLTGAHTIKMAYALNRPMSARRIEKAAGCNPDNYSLLYSDCENIVIETIKKAEADSDIVVRMYESFNMKTKTTIKFNFDVKKCSISDMLENEIKELPVENNSVVLDVDNFEIVTLKLKR